jgi:hypothetical protein
MQTQPANMTTLTSVLEKLKQKRWDNEFIYEEDKGFTLGLGKHYQPEDLKVIKTYRFEGASDPGDMMVVYIILTNDGRTGYSMDAYGTYSNHEGQGFDDFIRKIPVEEREEQQIFE